MKPGESYIQHHTGSVIGPISYWNRFITVNGRVKWHSCKAKIGEVLHMTIVHRPEQPADNAYVDCTYSEYKNRYGMEIIHNSHHTVCLRNNDDKCLEKMKPGEKRSLTRAGITDWYYFGTENNHKKWRKCKAHANTTLTMEIVHRKGQNADNAYVDCTYKHSID